MKLAVDDGDTRLIHVSSLICPLLLVLPLLFFTHAPTCFALQFAPSSIIVFVVTCTCSERTSHAMHSSFFLPSLVFVSFWPLGGSLRFALHFFRFLRITCERDATSQSARGPRTFHAWMKPYLPLQICARASLAPLLPHIPSPFPFLSPALSLSFFTPPS